MYLDIPPDVVPPGWGTNVVMTMNEDVGRLSQVGHALGRLDSVTFFVYGPQEPVIGATGFLSEELRSPIFGVVVEFAWQLSLPILVRWSWLDPSPSLVDATFQLSQGVPTMRFCVKLGQQSGKNERHRYGPVVD